MSSREIDYTSFPLTTTASVSDLMELTRRIREHSELLSTTLRCIGDAVLTTDNEGRITFLNPIAEQLSGWRVDEAQGLRSEEVFRVVNETTRIIVESPIDKVLREGKIVGLANHTVLIDRHGDEHPIDDSGAPILDEHGNLLGAVLVFRDVTERRRTHEALQRLAAIIQTSDDAIVSKDLNGIVTSWNASAERLYGYSADEMIGYSKAKVIPPQLPSELANILAKIRSGERIDHYETVRLRKDGTLIDLSISVSPILDRYGKIVGASTIARDISERKRVEEMQRRHRVEIEALNEQLRNSMKETHHRVRNSLQLIAALADMQSMDDRETVPVSDLRRIIGQVHALASVHDILTKEAGRSGDADDLSAEEMLDRLITIFRGATPGREIAADLQDCQITAKQGTSLAVITNELVTNALKHSDGTVFVRLFPGDSEVRLEVLDEGPGFPADFNLDRSERTGLALVRQVAKWDLGGSIEFRAGPSGKGALVVLTIPLECGR